LRLIQLCSVTSKLLERIVDAFGWKKPEAFDDQ